MKFGGSSVAQADRIAGVQRIIADKLNTSPRLVVVVSALGGITDMLLDTAKMAENGNEAYRENLDEIYYRHRKTAEALFDSETVKPYLAFLKEHHRNLENVYNGIFLIRELSPRVLDFVAAHGELLSSYMVAKYLQQTHPETQFVDSREVIVTNSDFTHAKVNFEATDANIARFFAQGNLFVMGGFIAANEKGVTTTLGRGGSDYTAAIIGAGLNADEIEIWTDVDGVMTADPRKVKKAFSLPQMTYEEAMEMSHFGAKVIHPPTVQPALDKKIPLRILNTFNPSHAGTLITTHALPDDHPVKGVSSIGDVAIVSVEGSGLKGMAGMAGRLFSALARHRVNVILITQASSEYSICFAIRPDAAHAARLAIEEEFAYELRAKLLDEPHIETQLSVVAVIGANMKNSIGVAGKMFNALAKNGINIRAIAQGSSELNISAVVGKVSEKKAINALHDAFFLSNTKTANVFLVGVGLIGETLLQQIARQYAYLQDRLLLDIKLVGIANTKKMLFDMEGIAPKEAKSRLLTEGENANLSDFVAKIQQANLPNSIFIDCTASLLPVKEYETLLESSISIVTPNKIANSGSMDTYLKYRYLSHKYGGKFLYETNVGAGLPVIGTLKGLMQSGDEVQRIEAVLSGSLSFIFNNFVGDVAFSDIVAQAQQKGFTEPDPRDDLSGRDVARKVLILSREIGNIIELTDIDIENILPQPCIDAPDVPAFFGALRAADAHFSQMRNAAAAEDKVLRFIATITPQGATVRLQTVGADNPFYALSGSDNMIVFTTARYNDRPLVVKGPGAGAEVTAAGIFAELIALTN